MQEEEKQNGSSGTPSEQPKKHKKEKGKSLIETMREIDAKEAQKEAEAEERRQEILDAAVRLISERGYNGTSVQDVADAVGVTKPRCITRITTRLAVWKTSWPPACLVQCPMISDCPRI